MSPPRNTRAIDTPIRQSCDRCHTQKLRCTRTDSNNTGACSRCLRKRAQCTYSFSLPKGRPTVYHLSDDPTVLRADMRLSMAPQIREIPEMVHSAPTDSGTFSQVMDEPALFKSIEDLALAGETWPNIEGLTSYDTKIHLTDLDPHLPTLHNAQNTDGQWPAWPPAQKPSTEFPELLDWSLMNNNPMVGSAVLQQPPSPVYIPEPPHLLGYEPGRDKRHFDTRNAYNGNIADTDSVIVQLSQLSMRLSLLRRVADDLAATWTSPTQHANNQPNLTREEPLIDDATFESVAAWVVRSRSNSTLSFTPYSIEDTPETSTTGDLLCNMFSGSSQLLESLQYLQQLKSTIRSPGSSFRPSTPASSSVDAVDAPFRPMNSESSSSSSPSPCNQTSDQVIRHLVIACHTVLMNTYASVLGALEKDAILRGDKGTPAVGELRLVSVIQFCAYLSERQHHAIRIYLSERDHRGACSQVHPHLFPGSAIEEEMRHLWMEVQKGLARLKHTLGC